ncbi:MAG: hypothetical protein ACM3ZE_13635, partial [Myxococcales bacterium]
MFWGSSDAPLACEVLGCELHLEALAPGDIKGLLSAQDLLLQWLGSSLRWTLRPMGRSHSRFVPEDLTDLISHLSRLAEAGNSQEPAASECASILFAGSSQHPMYAPDASVRLRVRRSLVRGTDHEILRVPFHPVLSLTVIRTLPPDV